MVLELCNTDLLDLVNGKQVAVGDLIVRPTESDVSNVTGAAAPAERPERRERGGNRRTYDGPRKPRKTGAHVISSKFRDNGCAHPGCDRTWPQGERMIYDYDARKPYCLPHGVERFPELKSEAEA
jgi:hypothetical protein